MTPVAKLRLMIDEEGPGWFRGRVGNVPVVGIWRYRGGVLTVCWNHAGRGFPKSFEDGEQRDVVTLRER
jgi:hypothetical protein